MDQQELRQWEHRCIQEETPRCVAACPIHVDARKFCSLMGQRRWQKGWESLARTMPLPGVLARICDGPCKSECVRKDAGGAIEVDALERFCADIAQPVAPPRPLPSRHKSVAVVGGGMAGLSAAWEMARRGFEVALHCGELGEGPLAEHMAKLPEGVLAAEVENLKKLGVALEQGVDMSSALVETLLEQKDAVFVDGDVLAEPLADAGRPDELTLGTRRAGLFVSLAGNPSPVFQAAAGRRAANSIERFTQGVSMVSNRDKEGPYETRLFTSLAGVEDAHPACGSSCTEETARDEARRCVQCECLECVKVCEYLKHYQQYPKIYARQIYNNESIVMGTRQANQMINSCMLCGLCKEVCPEDFDMGVLCLDARRTLVAQGHMPPSAHEFALRDMAYANGERAAMARHAPGEATSEYLFFPGCQLTASDPKGVEAAYADLRARLGKVGLLLHCCSAPAEWAGRESLAAETLGGIRAEWQGLGSPRIIAACPTCLKTLRAGLPEAEIISHWAILRTLGLPEGAKTRSGPLALNDPCAARHDGLLREDVRVLLDGLEAEVAEPALTGELTECCGYGGLLNEANPELAEQVTARRAQAMDQDWVTYCVMCRDLFAKSGKRALHCYDLIYPRSDDPAARPSPGYSERRENRARLKERLLAELWKEQGTAEVRAFETVEVAFTDQAVALMDRRRILKSDVQKVLLRARESGGHFKHKETGHHLASFRPNVVTYWVEYEEQGEGYLVHKVWSHRMKIKGGQP